MLRGEQSPTIAEIAGKLRLKKRDLGSSSDSDDDNSDSDRDNRGKGETSEDTQGSISAGRKRERCKRRKVSNRYKLGREEEIV